jgi:hypothetical protein
MPGWTGTTCDTDVNECDVTSIRDACIARGATCVNTPGNYTCRCGAGYAFNDTNQCQGDDVDDDDDEKK